jgi:hypothetical protein
VQHDTADADDDAGRDLQQLQPNRVDLRIREFRVLQAFTPHMLDQHVRRRRQQQSELIREEPTATRAIGVTDHLKTGQ